MKRFLDLIRAPKPTSVALRAALAEADLDAARTSLAHVEGEYRRVLMSGDDTALGRVEADITNARRHIDRTVILREEITARLAEAETREADEALMAERDSVEAEAAAVAKSLKNTYPKLANEITSILNRLIAAEEAVQQVNKKILQAKRPNSERLTSVEQRVFPDHATRQLAEITSVTTRTQIPAIEGFTDGYRDRPDVMYPMIPTPTGADYPSPWGKWA